MKKICITILSLSLFTGFAFATDMIVTPGSLNANIGLGLGYSTGLGIGGGVEYAIGSFKIADTVPFSWGAAVRAGLSIGEDSSLSAAALATLHFCWGYLDSGLPFFDNLDTYIGLGLAVVPGLYLESIGGFSYYFSDSIAINLEGGLKAAYLGVLFKL